MILIDQLKEVYIDSQLETIDTTNWYPKVMRKDYTVGLNLTGSFVDDPDDNFYRNYTCGAEMNYNGYCNPDVDKLIDQQSVESDRQNRREARMGDRKEAGGGRRPADHLLRPRRDVLAASGEGADGDGQQHLQRLAHGGRLARQIGGGANGPEIPRVRSSREPHRAKLTSVPHAATRSCDVDLNPANYL